MFNRRRRFGRTAAPAAPRAPAAPERLEARVLLAAVPTAGHLDPTFGYAGSAAFADFGVSRGSALQPDGRLVMSGTPSAPEALGQIALARFNADGSPDGTFGVGGKVLHYLGHHAEAGSVVVQPDGRILVAGTLRRQNQQGLEDSFVARLLPDGRLDSSFGTAGVFAADMDRGRPDGIGAVAVAPDGRILAAYDGPGGGFGISGVLRLTAAGALDLTFDGDGARVLPVGAGWLSALLVGPDGSVLVTGQHAPSPRPDWFFARLNPDGSPDATFGARGDGTALGGLADPDGTSMSFRLAPAPGGGFYAAGSRDSSLLVGRFLPDGRPDATFDGDGYAAAIGLDSLPGWAHAGGLVPLPDGRVVVAGSAYLPEPNPAAGQSPHYAAGVIARFNADGSPDATFGDGGIVDDRDRNFYTGLWRQADGKLLAPGNAFDANRYEDALRPPAVPVPVHGGPYRATEAQGVVALSAAGSYDLDGGILRYEWDLDYDGVTFTPDVVGRTPEPLRQLDGPLNHAVALRVTDDEGRASIATTSLTIVDTPPNVYFSAPRVAKEGSPFVLHLFAKDAGPDTIDHWTIDWGDGSPVQTVAGEVTVVPHTYRDGPGRVAVRVSATDEDGTWPAADLGPDLSFGNDGTANAAWSQSVHTVLPTEDGKVLFAGHPQDNGRQFEIYRLGADGVADSTFTSATTFGFGRSDPLPHQGRVTGIARQADGKILAVGMTHTPNAGFFSWAAVARYTPDGRLDPTFGTGGVVELDIDDYFDDVGGILALPDGKILFGGRQDSGISLVRLLPDGRLDPTFGTGGAAYAVNVWGAAENIALAPDGKIVVGSGSSLFDDVFMFTRFHPDGSIDAAFGDSGVTTVPVPGDPARKVRGGRMAVLPDGRIVATGQAYMTEGPAGAVNSRAAVVRLDADGNFDPTFGGQGYAFPRAFTGWENVAGLVVDAQGRVLVATSMASNDGYALTRLTPDGAVDTTFANTGTMKFDPAAGTDHVSAMGIDAAGNVAIAGVSQFNFQHRPTIVRLSPHGSHEVANVPPTVTVTGTGGFSDAPYTIGLGYADVGEDTPRSWLIDWGDGTTSELPGDATSASHPYAFAETYTVTARVTDDDGTFAATHLAHVVAPPTPAGDGTLRVSGPFAVSATINLSVAGDQLVVGIGARQWTFPVAGITRVDVEGGFGFDTLDLAASFVTSGIVAAFDGSDAGDKLIVRGTAGDDEFATNWVAGVPTLTAGGRTVATLSAVEAIDVFGEAGADRVTIPENARPITVRLDGGEGDDTMESGNNLTRAILVGGAGTDAITFRVPAGVPPFHEIRSGSFGGSTFSGVERVSVYGGAASETFSVASTAAGTAYLVYGGGGNDSLRMSSSAGGTVDLNAMLGTVTFDGGDGTDEVDLTDGLAPAPAVIDVTYDLSDSSIARVGGSRVDFGGVETVRFRTGRNRDTYRVTPSPTATFFLSADTPGAAAGLADRLEIIPAGATGAWQTKTNATSGRYDFGNRRTVNYLGFDSFNDVVAPRPSNYTYWAGLGTYTVRWGEDVVGTFSPADLSFRDASTSQVLSPTAVGYDPATRTATYTVGTLPPGRYAVTYAPAGVADAAGNVAVGAAPELTAAGVAGRHVFYNHSALDGRDANAAASDDGAVAGNKVALRPGQSASMANVTNFSRGLNGIMLDVFGLFDAQTRLLFATSDGSGGAGATWTAAPPPVQVTRRPGAGARGSDRITIVWPDGAILNRWLRVTLPADPAAGLAAADVFCFGNLAGETGGAGTAAPTVTATDLARTRGNVGNTSASALAASDFNRDGVVNATDVTIVRNNQRRSLPWVSLPVPVAPAAGAAPVRAPLRRPGRGLFVDPGADVLA